MDFQIKPLPAQEFAHLFALTDAELAAHHAHREIVTEAPGTPCRVSMEDAAVGETVILCNYEHQPQNTPYKARHAVFVRQNAQEAAIAVNEVPVVIRSRLISLRFFDNDHMMVDADVVPGGDVASALSNAFDRPDIAYAHIHNAKPGCFAASVYRAE